MMRICTTLAALGYDVLLTGRLKKASIPLPAQPYRQVRLFTFFEKGKLFYVEYNIRLFLHLLFLPADLYCAIDLDSILPVLWASRLRRKIRVYDAHELFCEMKEIVTRPVIYKAWKFIERISVPHFPSGYTVTEPIAAEFMDMYSVRYPVIRNVPFLLPIDPALPKENYLIYQGAVNEGRSFETLIPAMQWINMPLLICGDGNFMEQAKKLVGELRLTDKVIFRGLVPPTELLLLTRRAKIGLTLFENNGRSNYLSLANRFFDYFHAGTPQVCVNYPAYREINNNRQVAVVVTDLGPENIAETVNNLLDDNALYDRLRMNCLLLREEINWEKEKHLLARFYHKIFYPVE